MPKAPSKKRSTKTATKKVAPVPDKDDSIANTLIHIDIEHCKSWSWYKTRAKRVVEALETAGFQVEASMNKDKPRRGALEVKLVKDGKDYELWTAVNLGPPRNLKEPDMEAIVSRVKALIWGYISPPFGVILIGCVSWEKRTNLIFGFGLEQLFIESNTDPREFGCKNHGNAWQ